MVENKIYEEKLRSNRTEALFITFTILFLLLFIWRVSATGSNVIGAVLFFFFIFFLFYSVNYRTLIILINQEFLKLKFGVFSWTIPIDNIGEFNHDDPPVLMKYGGAGIHFFKARGRYRASFNFLEHPRVVISFKKKVGPVLDISFSTQHPDEVIQFLQNTSST